ncbi:hypothetical protein EVAR_29328_1 [Eumeta japonica]|uniref:Uncharacterized protein n=1 Tax=Eumeta variegata TaxID=151549 RepID=A0A4C1WJR6_EUMVA|nr:hypothetical protein EVAR_29328_1 [Eumeta japonica]
MRVLRPYNLGRRNNFGRRAASGRLARCEATSVACIARVSSWSGGRWRDRSPAFGPPRSGVLGAGRERSPAVFHDRPVGPPESSPVVERTPCCGVVWSARSRVGSRGAMLLVEVPQEARAGLPHDHMSSLAKLHLNDYNRLGGEGGAKLNFPDGQEASRLAYEQTLASVARLGYDPQTSNKISYAEQAARLGFGDLVVDPMCPDAAYTLTTGRYICEKNQHGII